jgi:beta propeller repeat protein
MLISSYIRDLQTEIKVLSANAGRGEMNRVFTVFVLALAASFLDAAPVAAASREISQVSATPTYHLNPAVDGKIVAYQALGSTNTWQIFITDTATGREQQITTGPHDASHPRISGNNLVYQTDRVGSGQLQQIFLHNLKTQTETQISDSTGYNQFPTIDKNNVVWVENQSNTAASQINVYDISSQQTRRIALSQNYLQDPSVYGEIVAWTDFGNGGSNTDIYGFNLSKNTEFTISTASGNQAHPQVYKHYVIWDDQRRGPSESDVYLGDLTTATETLVSNGSDICGRPVISGNTVAYVNFSNNSGNLFEYSVRTGSTRQITNGLSPQSQPAISTNVLVWTGYQGTFPEIYLLEAPTNRGF